MFTRSTRATPGNERERSVFSQEFTNAAANAAGNEYAGTRGALANARPTFSGTLSCCAVAYGLTITRANGPTFSGTNGAA